MHRYGWVADALLLVRQGDACGALLLGEVLLPFVTEARVGHDGEREACREDGRVGPGTHELAHGLPARNGIARDYETGTPPGREGIAKLRSLASAWTPAHQQGLPFAPSLLSLAETVRDRRRAALVEAGGRASVRMLFPVALFIFPVFLVVLLYPAGVELLGLGE